MRRPDDPFLVRSVEGRREPQEAWGLIHRSVTVFSDPLASTLPDDQHSEDELRWITIGTSSLQRLLFVVYTEDENRIRLIGARQATQTRNDSMKKSSELDPLAPRPDLDFSKGVRGKHFKSMREGTNLVVLDPGLMDVFPDSEAVNGALRLLKEIATRNAKPVSRQR